MNTRTSRSAFTRISVALIPAALLALVAVSCALPGAKASAQAAAGNRARTPSEVVREFYRALREKRFHEALAMSIYQPAVEGLSAEEFEELRPEFERLAAAAPEQVKITGEQISGGTATVFIKNMSGEDSAPPDRVELLRSGNAWIVGKQEDQEFVRRSGKKFFLEARIETHHEEVRAMLQRISTAQFIYASQHGGTYGDLNALVRAGLVPQDLLSTETTGYRFRVAPAANGKSYTAGAEPVRYGRTGRLSFYIDQKGIASKDTGGKPLKSAKD